MYNNLSLHTIILSVGSNTNSARWRVKTVLKWLSRRFNVTATSTVYTTPEISGRFADYCNAVIIARTQMTPEEITYVLKNYERANGRTNSSKTTGRVNIDIDLIAYNDNILRFKELNRDYFTIGWNQVKHAYPYQIQSEPVQQQKCRKFHCDI